MNILAIIWLISELSIETSQSGNGQGHLVYDVEKLNSLASIDSKETIVEENNDKSTGESEKVVITHPDFVHSTNLLVNKPNINVSAVQKSTILNLITSAGNVDDNAGISDSNHGSSYVFPILQSVNYDNSTAPTTLPDMPVEVYFALKIIHLADFNSKNMDYSIDFEMQMSWFDIRLMNNYTKWIQIREESVIDQIWKPDPYFVNSKQSHFHYVSFPNFRMLISPNGIVIYTMRVTLQPVCHMEFCRFPHDSQQCQLMISSLSHVPITVRFLWHPTNPVHFTSTIRLPDFNIVAVQTHKCHVDGKLIPSSCIRALFKMQRTGTRFIVEKYVPSALAIFFAWIAPFVPYHYEEVRIITPITEERRIEAVNEFERENLHAKEMQFMRLQQRLDHVAQILLPVVFTTFVIYYVMIVVYGKYYSCSTSKANT